MEALLDRPPIHPIDDPIELELLAIQELARHPEVIQLQLLCLAGLAVGAAIESAVAEET